MWRFDQGRMAFFQFDEIRKIAKYAVSNDLKTTTRKPLVDATGLPFYPADEKYPPWRNYSRVFKTALIVAEIDGVAKPTKLAELLSLDGTVTSDEYFHFLAQAFTDPAPSFQEWDPENEPRFPLLFTLKFALARAVLGEPVIPYKEIIAAYKSSLFNGDEDQYEYVEIAKKTWSLGAGEHRQASESIQVISQISYLSATSTELTVSLDNEDIQDLFESLSGVRGDRCSNKDAEIIRITDLFESSISALELDYPKTALDQTAEAGFTEGTRVERTHVTLERNAAVRGAFFAANPTSHCHFCKRDTASEYPWADRILDIHHVLPLCSGTRSTIGGTVLTDLVAVCPTCHRAIHRFYAKWLKDAARKDFVDAAEAREVYEAARETRKEA